MNQEQLTSKCIEIIGCHSAKIKKTTQEMFLFVEYEFFGEFATACVASGINEKELLDSAKKFAQNLTAPTEIFVKWFISAFLDLSSFSKFSNLLKEFEPLDGYPAGKVYYLK